MWATVSSSCLAHTCLYVDVKMSAVHHIHGSVVINDCDKCEHRNIFERLSPRLDASPFFGTFVSKFRHRWWNGFIPLKTSPLLSRLLLMVSCKIRRLAEKNCRFYSQFIECIFYTPCRNAYESTQNQLFFCLSHESIWFNTWESAWVMSWYWVSSPESRLSHESIWINTWGSAWVVSWFWVNSLESHLSHE